MNHNERRALQRGLKHGLKRGLKRAIGHAIGACAMACGIVGYAHSAAAQTTEVPQTWITYAQTVGAAIDPCAALQATISLAPNETRDVIVLLGAARGADEARSYGSSGSSYTSGNTGSGYGSGNTGSGSGYGSGSGSSSSGTGGSFGSGSNGGTDFGRS